MNLSIVAFLKSGLTRRGVFFKEMFLEVNSMSSIIDSIFIRKT